MANSRLPFGFRWLGDSRKLRNKIEGIPQGTLPPDIPDSTGNSMYLEDHPWFRLQAAIGNGDLKLLDETPGGRVDIEVSDLCGVKGSKSSGKTWEDFCRDEARPHHDHLGNVLGCASIQDARRLICSLEYADGGPVHIFRFEWDRKIFWASGEGGGSHRIAACVHWSRVNNTRLIMDAKETIIHPAKERATLLKYRLGLMPSASADALCAALMAHDVFLSRHKVDTYLLYRSDVEPMDLIGIPHDDAIAELMLPSITGRKDWRDITTYLRAGPY